MYPLQSVFNIIGIVSAVAFFAAFVLTFWPSKLRLALAGALYGIGITASLSPLAYYRFFYKAPPDQVLTTDPLIPLTQLVFGIASIILLWSLIPKKLAIKSGIVLFLILAPLLVFYGARQEYLRFHHVFTVNWNWLLYGLIWFRIIETRENEKAAC
jgi:hypothetical protein